MHNSPDGYKSLETMEPQEIADKIRRHVAGCAEAKHGAPLLMTVDEPFDLADYKRFCREYLNLEDILSDELLQKRLEFIMKVADVKAEFPEGDQCFIVVIPVSEHGHRLVPGDEYQFPLTEDKVGKTNGAFCGPATYLMKLLPEEFRTCSFTIPKYGSDAENASNEEKQVIADKFEEAFRKAQAIFNQR